MSVAAAEGWSSHAHDEVGSHRWRSDPFAPRIHRAVTEPEAQIRAVGRPRLKRGRRDDPRSPRTGIVNAATKLFSEKGYAQTTMSDIARAAGLQQSSLYYWFRNKERLLQETLLVNRAPLKFIAEVGAGSGSPAVKLYRLLRFDTLQLALSPIDFNEIQRIAHEQRAEFAPVLDRLRAAPAVGGRSDRCRDQRGQVHRLRQARKPPGYC